MAEDSIEALARRYAVFAEIEAKGRSPLYVIFAGAIAADADVLQVLATLPPTKQQPNLVLSAVRFLYGTPSDWPQLRALLLENWPEIEAMIMARATQTNEPARCATLLPVLAQLPQPFALIEVGASSGLCLLPDRYAYAFNGVRLPSSSDGPLFSCAVNAATPIPSAMPDLAWRAGLDLNPIDVRDAAATAWLEALVWPGEGDRLEQLRRALTIAAAAPPRLVQGDLRRDLPGLAAEVPKELPIVVIHTAVLAYVTSLDDRLAFAATVRELGATWVCNEAADLFPAIAARAPDRREGANLLSVNGRPVGWAEMHGASLEWFGPQALDLAWA